MSEFKFDKTELSTGVIIKFKYLVTNYFLNENEKRNFTQLRIFINRCDDIILTPHIPKSSTEVEANNVAKRNIINWFDYHVKHN